MAWGFQVRSGRHSASPVAIAQRPNKGVSGGPIQEGTATQLCWPLASPPSDLRLHWGWVLEAEACPLLPQGEAWSLWGEPGRLKRSHTRFCVSEAGVPSSSLRMKTRLGQPPGSLGGWTPKGVSWLVLGIHEPDVSFKMSQFPQCPRPKNEEPALTPFPSTGDSPSQGSEDFFPHSWGQGHILGTCAGLLDSEPPKATCSLPCPPPCP